VSWHHSVQLFDSSESLADAVADFMLTGASGGEKLLMVLTPEHWAVVAPALEAKGYPVADAIAQGRLTVLDAAASLSAITRNHVPDAHLFDVRVGALVRQLAAASTRLRVYGEMVDLLAARGDFTAAESLEDLWNALGSQIPLELFCGYSSVHFGHPRSKAALRAICATHNSIRLGSSDELGAWLVADALATNLAG
jgi:hypothetical protein